MQTGWAAFAGTLLFLAGIIIGVNGGADMYQNRIKSGLVQTSDLAVYRTTRVDGAGP